MWPDVHKNLTPLSHWRGLKAAKLILAMRKRPVPHHDCQTQQPSTGFAKIFWVTVFSFHRVKTGGSCNEASSVRIIVGFPALDLQNATFKLHHSCPSAVCISLIRQKTNYKVWPCPNNLFDILLPQAVTEPVVHYYPRASYSFIQIGFNDNFFPSCGRLGFTRRCIKDTASMTWRRKTARNWALRSIPKH